MAYNITHGQASGEKKGVGMKEHRIRINEVSWNKLVAMSNKQFDAHERMEQAIDLIYDNYIFTQTNFDYSEDIRSRLSSIESLLQGMDTDLL